MKFENSFRNRIFSDLKSKSNRKLNLSNEGGKICVIKAFLIRAGFLYNFGIPLNKKTVPKGHFYDLSGQSHNNEKFEWAGLSTV